MLVQIKVCILFDVADTDTTITEVKKEVEMAINGACTQLELSDLRDRQGSVSYSIEAGEI